MITRKPSILTIATAIFIGSVILVGCGSEAGPDPTDQKQNVANAQSMRSYFEKAGGDYEKLTPEDKAAYVAVSGGEEKAKQNWDLMKNGPGRSDSTDK